MPSSRNKLGAKAGAKTTEAGGQVSASGSGSGKGNPPAEEPEAKHQKLTDSCPICLMPFQQPAMSKCGHVFCLMCVTEMISNSTDFPRCPLCRRTL